MTDVGPWSTAFMVEEQVSTVLCTKRLAIKQIELAKCRQQATFSFKIRLD
jgi:hypothetical protein